MPFRSDVRAARMVCFAMAGLAMSGGLADADEFLKGKTITITIGSGAG